MAQASLPSPAVKPLPLGAPRGAILTCNHAARAEAGEPTRVLAGDLLQTVVPEGVERRKAARSKAANRHVGKSQKAPT